MKTKHCLADNVHVKWHLMSQTTSYFHRNHKPMRVRAINLNVAEDGLVLTHKLWFMFANSVCIEAAEPNGYGQTHR